jgi:putative phosphoribosyl transferase
MQTQAGEEVKIHIGSTILNGELVLPGQGKTGLVIFAHGSGSSRFSPRNKWVARNLSRAGFGTFLFDLLTRTEDENYETRFDITLLTSRLLGATRWILANYDSKRTIKIGYFGASTGAAAALRAAQELKEEIAAVVSRGGRPDLASPYLPGVTSPTLLIVGERDQDVLELNRHSLELLGSRIKELVVVPGATHLFEEKGALDQVARYATGWFEKYL